MRLPILALAIVSVISCGKKEESKKTTDYGASKVQSQKQILENKHKYSFDNSNELTNYKCSELFLDDSIVFLDLSSSYTKKVIATKKFDRNKTQAAVDDYNTLLEDLSAVVDMWDDSCEDKTELKSEKQTYKSSYKFKVNQSGITNSLVSSLSKVEKYKEVLNRLLGAANKGQTPSLSDLKNIHLYQQVLYSKERAITSSDVLNFEDKMDSILDKLDPSIKNKSFGEFKVAYEKEIEKKLNKVIQYNRAYYSVPSKILKGKSQCLGGTKTDLLLNVKLRGSDFYQKRPVVILSSGHILPGHLVGHADEWHLFGTETTLAGKAAVYYGDIREISSLSETILVVDALDYLFVNGLQYYLSDSRAATKKIIMNFANKYKVENIKNLYSKAMKLYSSSISTTSLNGDIFSFGSSSQTAGTFSRKKTTLKSKTGNKAISEAKLISSIKSRIRSNKLTSKISNVKSRIDKFSFLALPVNETSTSVAFEQNSELMTNAISIYSIVSGNYTCQNYDESGVFKFFFNGQNARIVNDQHQMTTDLFMHGEKEFVGRLSDSGVNVGMMLFSSNILQAFDFQGYIQNFEVLFYSKDEVLGADATPQARCYLSAF